MSYHEDEPTVGAKHPMHGLEGGVQVGNVHQAELAGHAVEGGVVESPQLLCVIHDVADVGVGGWSP